MTNFEKLEIAGIRSVHPDRPIEIEFFKPLTLITGPNGAGKTTIIESLLYACTGDCPPGSQKGRLFCSRSHAPKGQVNLRRSLLVSLNNGKLKLTSGDFIGTVSDGDGQPSLGSNIVNKKMDFELSEIIETSKQMLDSVLFCHQEESIKRDTQKDKEIIETKYKTYQELCSDLNKYNEKIQQLENQKISSQKSLSSTTSKVEELKQKLNEYNAKVSEIERHARERDILIEKLKSKEDYVITDSLEELEKKEQDFENAIRKSSETPNTQNTKLRVDLENALSILKNQITEETTKLGALSANETSRVELENNTRNELKISSNEPLMSAIQNQLKSLSNEIDKIQNEQEIQNNNITQLKNDLSPKESELHVANTNMSIKNEQLLNEQNTLTRIKTDQKKIFDLINSKKTAKSNIESIISDLNNRLSSQDFSLLESQKRAVLNSVLGKIDHIDSQLDAAHKIAHARFEVSALQKVIDTNNAFIGDVLNKIQITNVKEELDRIKNVISTSITNEKNITSQSLDVKKQRMQNDARLNQIKNEKKRIENELQSTLESIKSFGNEESNKQLILDLKEKEKGIWTIASDLIDKACSSGSCPICGNTNFAHDDLQHKKETFLQSGEFKQEDKEQLKKLEGFETNRHHFENLSKKLQQQLDKLGTEELSLIDSIEESKRLEDELDQQLDVLKKEIETSKELESQLTEVDSKQTEIRINQEKIQAIDINKDIPTVEVLQQEKKQCNQQKTTLESEIDEISRKKDINQQTKKNLEMKQNDLDNIIDTIKEYENSLESLTNSFSQSTQKVQELQKEINDQQEIVMKTKNILETLKKGIKEQENQITLQNEKIRQHSKNLSSRFSKLSHLKESLESSQPLEKIQNQIEIHKKKKIYSEGQVNQLNEKITQIKLQEQNANAASNALKLKKQKVKEEIELLKSRQALQAIKNLIETLNTSELQQNLSQIKRQLINTENLAKKEENSLHEAQWGLKETQSNIEKLNERKKECCSDGSIVDEFDKIAIESIVIKDTVDDLTKYIDVVDKSLIQYHQEKMKEINETINSLWTTVYSSQDIQTIKIEAETESSETSTRRSYSYRVCMVKDNTTLDMRGRCSMGQKALASVIIRIALAKTFCSKCSVLALDEPTINLDEDNCASLASQLCKLLADDGKLSQFQILLITHDESFVRKLHDFNDEYYRIERDSSNCSCIKRASFSELT
ncbi:Rad50/SbcC-type AAA domain-containing protein [Entamoeba marina]